MTATDVTTHALPTPGRWEIDPGTLTVAEDIAQSRVDVVIGMSSVSSGSADRDEDLRSAELLGDEEVASG